MKLNLETILLEVIKNDKKRDVLSNKDRHPAEFFYFLFFSFPSSSPSNINFSITASSHGPDIVHLR